MPQMHRTCLIPPLLACLGLQTAVAAAPPEPPAPALSQESEAAVERRPRLPFALEPNQGQFDERYSFKARSPRYEVGVAEEGLTLAIGAGESAKVIEISFPGLQLAAPRALERLPGTCNYFRSRRSDNWITGVPRFARVHFENAAPGVDVELYGNGGQLQYDFKIAPRADTSAVSIRLTNGDFTVAQDGRIVDERSELFLEAPLAWQDLDDGRHAVEVAFEELGENHFGFALGEFDAEEPLTIDPMVVYGSFFGGTNTDNVFDVAVDDAGNAYMTGSTFSSDIATPGAYDETLAGFADAFIAKVNPSGSDLVYVTYLGGSSPQDYGAAIGVDSQGRAVVYGHTESTDFPVQAAYQPTFGGFQDTFLAMLSPDGMSLVYSTYLGGSHRDYVYGGLEVNAEGTAHVSGSTISTDFPVVNALQPTSAGSLDCFVGKFADDGQPQFVTYLGGSGSDFAGHHLGLVIASGLGSFPGGAIELDALGNVILGGATTSSSNFPVTPGAYLSSGPGFISKLSADGQALLWSSRFTAWPTSIALDEAGDLYLAGQVGPVQGTSLATTPGAFQTEDGGGSSGNELIDSYVAKMNGDATALEWATYIGEQGHDRISDIEVDELGRPYVLHHGAIPGFVGGKIWLVRLSHDGTSVESAFPTGAAPATDSGNGLARGAGGDIWIAGYTDWSGIDTVTPGSFLPVPPPYNLAHHRGDGWILRVAYETVGTNYCTAAPNSSGTGATIFAEGSTQVAPGTELSLAVTDLPGSGTAGLFFFGTTQVQTPFGDGFRCAGGSLTRIQPPVFSTSNRAVVRELDFTAPYASAFVPGANLNFQFWYRDSAAQGTGFNTTDGLALSFQ